MQKNRLDEICHQLLKRVAAVPLAVVYEPVSEVRTAGNDWIDERMSIDGYNFSHEGIEAGSEGLCLLRRAIVQLQEVLARQPGIYDHCSRCWRGGQEEQCDEEGLHCDTVMREEDPTVTDYAITSEPRRDRQIAARPVGYTCVRSAGSTNGFGIPRARSWHRAACGEPTNSSS
jgi:hypothetical protein